MLAAVGPHLDDYVPDADVAILWDTPTKQHYEFTPPLNDGGGTPRRTAYHDIVGAFQRGAVAVPAIPTGYPQGCLQRIPAGGQYDVSPTQHQGPQRRSRQGSPDTDERKTRLQA